MQLAHLALTMIEDPEWEVAYHWVLLQAAGKADRMQEHSSSTRSFPTPHAAFDAGAAYSPWDPAEFGDRSDQTM